MNDPQKIVVYRSQGENMADEFWWSEGYLTPTMAGDAIVIGGSILVLCLLGSWIYNKFNRRRRRF